MSLELNTNDRHILHTKGGFSRQLIHHWEKSGMIPSKHLLKVSQLLGRKVEDLLGATVENDKVASDAR